MREEGTESPNIHKSKISFQDASQYLERGTCTFTWLRRAIPTAVWIYQTLILYSTLIRSNLFFNPLILWFQKYRNLCTQCLHCNITKCPTQSPILLTCLQPAMSNRNLSSWERKGPEQEGQLFLWNAPLNKSLFFSSIFLCFKSIYNVAEYFVS